MTAATVFGDPLGGMADERWDRLAGDHFYSSALWLRLCALLPGDAVSGAVSVGEQSAVSVVAVHDESNTHCRWREQLQQRGLPAPDADGLLVGARRGYLTHVLGNARQADPDGGVSAPVRTLVERLETLRHEVAGTPLFPGTRGSVPCVGLFLTTPDVLALRAAGVSAEPVLVNADAWIPIPAGGWEEWLDSLPSRHRARRIRHEARIFQAAGYDVSRRTLEECSDDVGRLLARTQSRYGRASDAAMLTAVFREQGKLAGPAAQVLLCGPPGEPPVGFCLYYRSGDVIYLRAAGFDYQRLRNAAEYFNLTYYLLAMEAGATGVRWLHAGIGSLEAKALRGAEIRPLWLLDLAADSVLNTAGEQVRVANERTRAGLLASSSVLQRAARNDLWQHLP